MTHKFKFGDVVFISKNQTEGREAFVYEVDHKNEPIYGVVFTDHLAQSTWYTESALVFSRKPTQKELQDLKKMPAWRLENHGGDLKMQHDWQNEDQVIALPPDQETPKSSLRP